jgi:hypothetical protein
MDACKGPNSPKTTGAMRSPLLKILRRLRSEQRGQSLIVVSLSMVVVLGVSALAIDVGTWYVKHHQDQVIADSAALAAANCLAHPNSGPNTSTMPQCTSGTDTTDAETVAVAYAARNGLAINDSDVDVNTSADTVQVTASSTAPAFFANLFGIRSTTQSANATAGWTSGGPTPCTTTLESAGKCAAIYAAGTSCSGTGNGVMFGGDGAGATITVTGGVQTEGQLSVSNGTYSASSTTVTSNCYTSSNVGSLDYGNIDPQLGATESWPINYAASPYFTACTTNCITLDGYPDVPPYCTYASESLSGITFVLINNVGQVPQTGNVYCAIGSGTASNPATWTGAITIGENIGTSGSSCSNQPDVTLIGASVTFTDSTTCLAPDLDNCLAYATTGNIVIYNGEYDWSGAMFAPSGSIDVGFDPGKGLQGSPPDVATGLLEAQNVDITNATFTLTGDGPVVSGSSSTLPGTDSLVEGTQ